MIYPQKKNVGRAHGFKTMCKVSQTTHGFIVHGLGPLLQMVLRPCARPPKQPIVLGGPCTWF